MSEHMKDGVDFHQALMDEAFALWRENSWTYPEFIAQLKPLSRQAVMLGTLNYQVGNGGWTQWEDNGYAACAEELLETLGEMAETCPLAPTVAQMVRDIVKAVQDEREVDREDYTYDYHDVDDDGDDYIEEVPDDDAYDAACRECYAGIEKNDDLYYTFDDDFLVQCEVWLRRKAGQDIPAEVLEAAKDSLARSVEKPVERKRPRVKLVGTNGNAFSVMSACTHALRKAGYSADEIEQYKQEAMSGDYDHLLAVSTRWCDAY